MTVTTVAAAIGLSRETVHRWQPENFRFIAAVNRGTRLCVI
jgi:post-segregation antitoxin (ccd killing protein)